MRNIIFATVFVLMLCTAPGVSGKTWYVDGAVSASGDGTSWETAFKAIQQGINAALDGDQVIVGPGTYMERIQFKGKNIVLMSSDPLDHDVVSNTVIDGTHKVGGSVVTFASNENESCILSGFTIQNGKADNGGGILGGDTYGDHTHATIKSNVITGNVADGVEYGDGGGGIAHCDGVIQSNVITGNSSTGPGGGLARCHGIIHGNEIIDNSAGGLVGGGGVYDCDGIIQNNLISGNSSAEYGGGICQCGGLILNNTITGNSSGRPGGGFDGCCAAIGNCIIWGNTPDQVFDSTNPFFSCIQNWMEGGNGNISDNPLFASLKYGDYHLQADSPCVDTGANGYWLGWPQRDLDGNCRLTGQRVDMGCYEYGSSPDSDGDLLPDEDEANVGTGPLGDDADGDGLRDGLEVLRGSDPLVSTSPTTLSVPSNLETIQLALCVALEGEEIIVSPGTYRESIRFLGTDLILRGSNPEDEDTVATIIIDAGTSGPAVWFEGSESEACVLSGFTIQNGRSNAPDSNGGGIRGNGTHATIERNVIRDNTATTRGGGLAYCDGPIRNNTIQGNSAFPPPPVGGGYGGGLIYCNGSILNNIIFGNSAESGGGGLTYCDGSIHNNVITENSAGDGGGGGLRYCEGVIRNCIVWGNTSPRDPQVMASAPSYSCIQGWTGGGSGNITQAPRFVNTKAGDYRLQAASPCIDRGRNEDWMWHALDMDSNPRIWQGKDSLRVDMGAYEYDSFPFKVVGFVETATGEAELTWNSRAGDTYKIWSCDDLLIGGWTERATVASEGETTSWTDLDATSVREFYRIEIE